MKDIVSQFAMQLTLAEKRELVAELKGAILDASQTPVVARILGITVR